MTPFLTKIIASLNSQNWEDIPTTFSKINNLLEEINCHRNLLYEEFQSHSTDKRRSILKNSREVSTHFKWHIYTNETLGFSIWINEYKNEELRKPGYAGVPHNHRYWFSSLILNGGFNNNIYKVDRIPNDESSYIKISVCDVFSYSVGNIYTLGVNDVHSLTNIQDSTVTFLIKSRGLKPYSEEFSVSTKKVIKHYTKSSKVEEEYSFIEKIK